jgi:hypothetical protein
MKKLVFLACFLSLSAGLFAAEAAVFREVKGKVEYQLEGEDWMPAKVGATLPKGAVISTGFKSTAALEVLGSVIMIKPLTRMVLDELVRTSSGTKTGLTLLSGKVKTEVKPSSATSATVFDVKSPTATASVRGTGFEFDGENILVNHGNVEFSNNWGVSRSVQGGEFSSAGGKGGSVSPPIPVKPAEKPQITAAGGSEETDAMFKDSSTPSDAGGDTGGSDAGKGGVTAPAAAPEYGLGQVIETYGDELLLDKGILSVVDEIKQIKEQTLAAQTSVTLYSLTVDIQ